mgnify:CR=1 FL=1
MEPILIFEQEWDGFESLYDLGRDVHEAFDRRFNPAVEQLPGEFQVTVTVTITPSKEDHVTRI